MYEVFSTWQKSLAKNDAQFADFNRISGGLI
jgi:hypothetical protein